MGAIDIGHGAATGGNTDDWAGYTWLDHTNPANDNGSLTSFEVYARSSITSLKIGTFYGSGTTWTNRDYETIGSVTSGSKQTFTGKNCSVSTDDLLGAYHGDGALGRYGSGGSGLCRKSGDLFGSGQQTEYSHLDEYWLSIYATGETAAAGWTTAKLGGIASASIIKVAGISVASVKKVAGVAVQ